MESVKIHNQCDLYLYIAISQPSRHTHFLGVYFECVYHHIHQGARQA